MGLLGSGMRLSDVTWPELPTERLPSRLTRTGVLPSLVRAPARPPRHTDFGSRSQTPSDRYPRFERPVTVTPAGLAPVLLARFGRTRLSLASSSQLLLTHPAPGSPNDVRRSGPLMLGDLATGHLTVGFKRDSVPPGVLAGQGRSRRDRSDEPPV